jgi:transcriptional regulator of acetoin/glycerol metabolism
LSESEELSADDFGILTTSGLESVEGYNLEKLEAWAIRNAVIKHKGNISHAAVELGLSRGAMYRRMEKYGL